MFHSCHISWCECSRDGHNRDSISCNDGNHIFCVSFKKRYHKNKFVNKKLINKSKIKTMKFLRNLLNFWTVLIGVFWVFSCFACPAQFTHVIPSIAVVICLLFGISSILDGTHKVLSIKWGIGLLILGFTIAIAMFHPGDFKSSAIESSLALFGATYLICCLLCRNNFSSQV